MQMKFGLIRGVAFIEKGLIRGVVSLEGGQVGSDLATVSQSI